MPEPIEGTLKVKLTDIDVGERAREDMGDIYGLASSIKDNGLINPIIIDAVVSSITGEAAESKYVLIAGYRRYKAVESLKWEEIECRLYQDLSPFERRKLELEEDLIHKKNLSWVEEVKAKKELHELYMIEHKDDDIKRIRNQQPWSIEKTAQVLNTAKTTLSEELRLQKALEQFPELALVKSKRDAIKKMYRLREFALIQEQSRRAKERGEVVDESVKLIHGDCFDILPKLPDASIDLVVTDPAWGINLEELAGAGAISDDEETEFEDTPDSALEKYKKVIPEFYRLLKPGHHLYMFFGIEFYNQIYDCLTEAGFDVRQKPCVWVKDKPAFIGGFEYKPMPKWECFFFAVKASDDQRRQLNEATSDVFTYARTEKGEQKIHITEKPVSLIKALIRLSSNEGDIVLDPFAGSASVPVASVVTNRRCIGVEILKNIFDRGEARLNMILREQALEMEADGDGVEEE
jgi:DNA modification methylase